MRKPDDKSEALKPDAITVRGPQPAAVAEEFEELTRTDGAQGSNVNMLSLAVADRERTRARGPGAIPAVAPREPFGFGTGTGSTPGSALQDAFELRDDAPADFMEETTNNTTQSGVQLTPFAFDEGSTQEGDSLPHAVVEESTTPERRRRSQPELRDIDSFSDRRAIDLELGVEPTSPGATKLYDHTTLDNPRPLVHDLGLESEPTHSQAPSPVRPSAESRAKAQAPKERAPFEPLALEALEEGNVPHLPFIPESTEINLDLWEVKSQPAAAAPKLPRISDLVVPPPATKPAIDPPRPPSSALIPPITPAAPLERVSRRRRVLWLLAVLAAGAIIGFSLTFYLLVVRGPAIQIRSPASSGM